MTRLLAILSAALICAVVPASAQMSSISMTNTHKSPIGIVGKKSNAIVLGDTKSTTKTHALDKMIPGRQHRMAAPQTTLTARGFGFLEGPDGTTWTFKQDNTDGEAYAYSGSSVTVYDADNVEKGSFTVEIPEGMRINQIEPYGLVTNKLFDKNSSTYEVVVYLHEVGNADNGYKGTDHLWIYNLNGEKVAEFLGDGMVVDASPNDWTLYQRLVVAVNDDTSNNVNINIYKNPGWNDDSAVLEHTFTLDRSLIEYTDGPFLNFANVDDRPYYVLAHYDKSFVEYDEDGNQILDEETGLPYFTEDKHFIIEAYDKNYEQVANISVPCEPSSEDYFTRLVSFGTFSEHDLSRGFFTGDDKLNFIIMTEDANMLFEYNTSFVVYDQDGNIVKTIAESVGDYYNKMANIKGFDEQWIFLNGEGTGLYTVDLPSCISHDMPATIDDDKYSISTNIDRVPCKNDEGYQYIMALNEAKTDDTQTNVIASFAYLNPDFSLDHYVDINLGPLAQTFSPLVNFQGLDPYLFNTDCQHEFLFFSKLRDSDDPEQVGGHNTLFVANEKGDIVETFNLTPGNEKGDIWTASILNYGTLKQSLFVNYYNWDEDVNTMEYYSLPLVKFQAGGDGTPENPYLVSSAGDMKMINRNPAANYKVACDFDAYGTTVALDCEFSGILDGDNHTINNLDVSSFNYNGGLFSNIIGGTIKNLMLYAPVCDYNPVNQQAGLLCGFAIEAKINNIFVNNGRIKGEMPGTIVGTLVGMATSETEISECGITETTIMAPANTVGGIVGEMRTSATVNACAAYDNTFIIGGRETGGIAGVIGTGCKVTNCFFGGNVEGKANVGGIAGSCGVNGNRAVINHCVVDNANVITYTGVNAGGVTGFVDPCWGEQAPAGENVVVNDNVVNNVFVGIGYDFDGNICENGLDEATVNRIIGYSKINEPEDSKGNPAPADIRFKRNYDTGSEYEGSDDKGCYTHGSDDASTDGLYKTTTEVAQPSFWAAMNYAFGETLAEPWALDIDAVTPRLYFMDEEHKPSRIEHATMPTFNVKAQGIYNIAGQRISISDHTPAAKGIYIINGKKIIK